MSESKDLAATELGRRGGEVGGRARAKKLSPEARSEISRLAAETRWKGHAPIYPRLPKATHEGTLRIAGSEIGCYVLEDGRRVLSQTQMIRTLGMQTGSNPRLGGNRLANFAAGKTIRPYVSKELQAVIDYPIRFRTKGVHALGYEATILPEFCEAVLQARDAGTLQSQQSHIAEKCDLLVRAFSRVGIIALVDEASGYQRDRDRDALHKLLEAYIAKELLPWTKRFPDTFYKELFRLRRWNYNKISPARGPRVAGKLTNQIVYERLPAGVLGELRARNPIDECGRRRYKHHQLLTEDVGHPHLTSHLASVTTLMRASTNWGQFQRLLDRAIPKAHLKLLPPETDDHSH